VLIAKLAGAINIEQDGEYCADWQGYWVDDQHAGGAT